MKVYIVMEEDVYAGELEGSTIFNVDIVLDSREVSMLLSVK